MAGRNANRTAAPRWITRIAAIPWSARSTLRHSKRPNMLEIQRLTKYYRNTPVVNDVSFTVRPGEVTGYLGPNGSGKSTTVKIITGLIEATTGKVLLDGRDIREDAMGFRRRLGYVPEEAILYSYLTGLEYLQLIGRLRRLPQHEVDR